MLRPVFATATAACALLLAPGSVKTASATCPSSFLQSTIGSDADCIFRDYATDGVPSSGINGVNKPDVRHWGETIGLLYQTILGILPVYDIVKYGASPSNSASANATAIQSAFSAVPSSGGYVHIPCAHFPDNAIPVATVGAHARFGVKGDGNGCAFLDMQGAGINGPTLTMTDANSSFSAEHFTVTTNQAGGTKAFVAQLLNGSGTTFSSSSYVKDIGIHGDDYFSTSPNAHWFDTGLDLIGMNNVNVDDGDCNGNNPAGAGNPPQTDCISFRGTGIGSGPGAYAVVLNVKGMTAANCKSLVNGKDWWQGIQATLVNASNCTHGVYGSLDSPSGVNGLLTELQVIGGQFATFGYAVGVEDAQFAGLEVTGAQIAALPGTGIKVQGTQFVVTGNQIACNDAAGTIGVEVGATFAQGGTIGHNNIVACAQGIKNDALSVAPVIEDNNHMVANGLLTAHLVMTASTSAAITGLAGACPLSLFAVFTGGSTTFTTGTFVTGNWYQIATLGGSPAFTTIGASSNTVGTIFQATGPGTGTGTALWVVEPGTLITVFGGSPLGSNGTYTVNNSQTFSGDISVIWSGPSPCDYVTDSSANDIVIDDVERRVFTQIPAYSNAIASSKFTVNDANCSTFDCHITAGAGTTAGGTAQADFVTGGYIFK